MTKKVKLPYSKRTDFEKIKSNWRKSQGLFEREEWSHAIVRSTTAVELAANLLIRTNFMKFNLDKHLVDDLLKISNGLQGKWQKLLIPLYKGKKEQAELKKMLKHISSLWDNRNTIVHGGEFRSKGTAKKRIAEAKEAINLILRMANERELD